MKKSAAAKAATTGGLAESHFCKPANNRKMLRLDLYAGETSLLFFFFQCDSPRRSFFLMNVHKLCKEKIMIFLKIGAVY